MRAVARLERFSRFAALSLRCSAGALLCAQPAHAEPLVRVRGESRLELGVDRSEAEPVLRAALYDELGAPLPGRRLTARVQDVGDTSGTVAEASVETLGDGRFELPLSGPGHEFTLALTFAGDDHHLGVQAAHRVDLSRAEVRLALDIDPVLKLDRESTDVRVRAQSTAGAQGLTIDVIDERGQLLARAQTDENGVAHARLDHAKLGSAGSSTLRAISLADDLHARAESERRILKVRKLAASLSVSPDNVAPGAEVTVRGAVHSADGPYANRAVSMFADGELITTLLTRADGSFETKIALPDRDRSEIVLELRTEADGSGALLGARVERRISVRSIDATWLRVLGVISAAMAAFVWWLRRARALALAAAPDETPAFTPRALSLAPPALRKPELAVVSGSVLEQGTATPIDGAVVTIRDKTGTRSAHTDANGFFALSELAAGTVQLRVEAPGFGNLELDLRAPHRGEWCGVTLRLESLRRAAATAAYGLAEPARAPRSAATWTPRELLAWIASHAPASAERSQVFRRAVERAAFSRPPPDADDLAQIRHERDRLAQELEAGARDDERRS